MTDLPSLLSRVMEAEGPDRELDALICVAFNDIPEPPRTFKLGVVHPPSTHQDWRVDCVSDSGVVRSYTSRPYTASLDVVVALVERVLPGWGIEVLASDRDTWRATVWPWVYSRGTRDDVGFRYSYATTPALALLAALLRAKATEEKQP